MTQPRHLRTLRDLRSDGVRKVLERAHELKRIRGTPAHPEPLKGKSVAILLEKASTRTRISFEVGIAELGGRPLTIIARDTQLGRGEPLPDTARMLSRYVHAVAYRTFGHDRIERLAAEASIPVINALSDKFHPCQILADLMTIEEHVRTPLEAVRVAWVGDGNNMSNSWIVASALLGFEVRVACPRGYEPALDVLEWAQGDGGLGTVLVTDDPAQAVDGAAVVTTDVWTSMGQEEETHERVAAFEGFQVTSELMAKASPQAIFLHCLPAHRGEEVTAEVIDGPASCVWDEAENRLHTQKAILELLLP
jgi:ornithine carbamoyltransferase